VGGDNSGTVYVVYGPVSPGTIGAGSLNDYITGEDLGDDVGAAMAVIDHNADGIDDLVLGSSKNSEGGTDAGSVYVVHGTFTGALGLDAADAQYTGESAADKLGDSVSAAGDMDGDGFDDFVVGAKFDDAAAPDAGAAYVVPGGVESGTFGSVDEFHIVKVTGEASEDQFGAHVVGGGDIDGDGGFDLMISAPFSGGTSDTGTVYVFYSPAAGTIASADADARFDGEDLSDQLGNSLAFAGDVDGGGNTALMIGASKKDTAGADAGGVYLMKALDL